MGYDIPGGCGSDSLGLFIAVLEQATPGVDRSLLEAVRRNCSRQDLDKAATGMQDLSPPCLSGWVYALVYRCACTCVGACRCVFGCVSGCGGVGVGA